MFTLEQIKEAQSKVKSGADFPAYFQDLKKLGIASYITYVTDGLTDYYGTNDFKISSQAMYDSLAITETSNIDQFISDLKAHQEGKTDFPTFCKDAAKSGIYKWAVDIAANTCSYFDKKDEKLLTEEIPQ